MTQRASIALALPLVLLACGGTASVESPGAGGAGSTSSSTSSTSGTSSSTSGTGGGGGFGATGCPPTDPTVMAACAPEGLRCSYGESVVPECRRGYRCLDGGWQVDGLGCLDGPPECGIPDPDGATCDVQSALCVDGERFCVCGPCGGAGCPDPPWGWSCGGVQGDPACPAVIPNDGTPCSQDGLDCYYGVMCASDRSITCEGGEWVWAEPMACP